MNNPFQDRLVPLSDGRPGLRSTIHCEVLPPSPHPMGRGAGGEGSQSTIQSPATLDFISSDATLDRYGEIICPGGWDLSTYARNPVFQNAHQYGDVIHTLGKALVTEIRAVAGRQALFQRIQFAVDANPIAKIAHALYAGGYLNAVSVGFIPTKWQEPAANSPFRLKYLQQELLEVSAVAIPANPNALALALKSGAICKSDLTETLNLLKTAVADTSPPNPLLSLAREVRNLIKRA